MTIAALKQELKAAATPERAAGAARYFKTGLGEYGEGDVFLGVTVPALRKIALRYKSLSLDELQRLLESKEHEYRAVALEILVAQHRHGDEAVRKDILKMYLRNTRYINNWDLVDLSCGEIVGGPFEGGIDEAARQIGEVEEYVGTAYRDDIHDGPGPAGRR